jgi:hypothetical protein
MGEFIGLGESEAGGGAEIGLGGENINYSHPEQRKNPEPPSRFGHRRQCKEGGLACQLRRRIRYHFFAVL